MPSRAKSVSKTHHVQLTVPPDFQLPEFYGSATPEMVEEALHIGATLYLLVKSSTANEEMDRIEEEKGKQISHLKEQHAKKIQELEREMEKGQEEFQRLNRERAQKILDLEIELPKAREHERESVLRQTEQTIRSLQQERDLLLHKEQASQQHLRTSYEARIQELEQAIRDTQEKMHTWKKEHQQSLLTMEQEYKEAESLTKRTERELVTKQMGNTIRALEQEMEDLKQKNQIYLERKQRLEESRDRDIQVAEERTRMSLQELLNEKDRTIQQTREDLANSFIRSDRAQTTFQEILKKNAEELQSLRESIVKRAANVKSKGDDFEEYLRLRILATFGTYEGFRLEKTASEGRKGDSIMRLGEHGILWEAKDYKESVGDKEVIKFRRDMKESVNVTIGVMVSRFHPIVGKTSTGDFFLEFVEGKMLIYISNFERMGDEILQMLMIFFRLYWKSGQKLEEDDGTLHIIHTIQKLHKELLDRRNDWRVHKASLEKVSIFTNDLIEETEHTLHRLLNDLQGVTEKVEVPEGVFRDCLGDESATQTIQTILYVSEHDPLESIELNELADLYVERRGNSLKRDTAKKHIQAVLLDASIQASKGKTPARVLGLKKKEQIQYA